VSYVSYETDIFACFNVWWGAQLVGGDPGVYEPELFADRFQGFDRRRIQHAGIRACFDNPGFYNAASILRPDVLPALRTLSVIPLGPNPDREGHPPPGWCKVEPETLQLNREFELRDVSPVQLGCHPFFSEACISSGKISDHHMNPLGIPSTKEVVLLIKAFAWHYAHGDTEEAWRSLENLEPGHLAAASRNEPCPLRLPVCGPGGHTLQDIVNRVLPYRMNVKLLCEKRCLEELEVARMFDEERTGWVGAFTPFEALILLKLLQRRAYPRQLTVQLVSDSSDEGLGDEDPFEEFPD
jgi:hypothetical protein